MMKRAHRHWAEIASEVENVNGGLTTQLSVDIDDEESRRDFVERNERLVRLILLSTCHGESAGMGTTWDAWMHRDPRTFFVEGTQCFWTILVQYATFASKQGFLPGRTSLSSLLSSDSLASHTLKRFRWLLHAIRSLAPKNHRWIYDTDPVNEDFEAFVKTIPTGTKRMIEFDLNVLKAVHKSLRHGFDAVRSEREKMQLLAASFLEDEEAREREISQIKERKKRLQAKKVPDGTESLVSAAARGGGGGARAEIKYDESEDDEEDDDTDKESIAASHACIRARLEADRQQALLRTLTDQHIAVTASLQEKRTVVRHGSVSESRKAWIDVQDYERALTVLDERIERCRKEMDRCAKVLAANGKDPKVVEEHSSSSAPKRKEIDSKAISKFNRFVDVVVQQKKTFDKSIALAASSSASETFERTSRMLFQPPRSSEPLLLPSASTPLRWSFEAVDRDAAQFLCIGIHIVLRKCLEQLRDICF